MDGYRLIDTASWSRYDTFRKFYDDVSCSISLCDDINVTHLKKACERAGQSFYIAMLYAVSRVVNAHEEFRLLAVDSPEYPAPMPAVWDRVDPVHNVFRESSGSYASIFTVWDDDFDIFSEHARDDIDRAKRMTANFVPAGPNVFEASCLPWRHFNSVSMECADYPLSPVIVWGGISERGGEMKMPLSVQISHASADGYHLARFINETEARAEELANLIGRQ